MKLMNPGIRLCAYLIGSGAIVATTGCEGYPCDFAMCENNPEMEKTGYSVECDPGAMDPKPICMRTSDWNCPSEGFYMKKALCAYYYSGSPDDYDAPNEPLMTGQADCALDANSVWDVAHDLDFGSPDANACSVCTACELQHLGATNLPGQNWTQVNDCLADEFPFGCVEEEAVPTTGAEDEGGDTGEVFWACNGSNILKGCLNGGVDCAGGSEVILAMSQDHLVCVKAPHGDNDAARQACFEACDGQNAFYDPMGDWDPEFACGNFGDEGTEALAGFAPAELAPGQEWQICTSPLPTTQSIPFDGEASLDIIDGTTLLANASSSGWVGLLDFSIVSPCPSTATTCAVTITEIYAVGTDISGEYDDGSTPLPMTIESPHFRLLQPVVGVLYQWTGVMSFPNNDFFLEISTGPTYLGSTPISAGVDNLVVHVDNPNGSYGYSTGVELSLEWSAGDLNLTVDLATW